jgi:hypothetical protein
MPSAACPEPCRRVEARTDSATSFDQLKTLVGEWRNAAKPASPFRIRFSLTAGGTVLVESWEAAGKPHSLTLYHRDGDALIATHYCPQGNQPRLKLTPGHGPKLSFTFRDATDLAPGESHLHDLAFDLSDPNRPIRTETYRQGRQAETTTLTLERTSAIAAPQAEAEIRAQRTAFNAAIAAGDVSAIASILADNVQMITGSDSIHVAGKQAHLDRWAEGFKDPNRLVYVRTTDRVTVSPLLPIALEYGHWRGAPAGSG